MHQPHIERPFVWGAGIALFVDVALISAGAGGRWRAILPLAAIGFLLLGVVRARRRHRAELERLAREQEHEPGTPWNLDDLPDAPPPPPEDEPGDPRERGP
jgi:hypothetical protein